MRECRCRREIQPALMLLSWSSAYDEIRSRRYTPTGAIGQYRRYNLAIC